MYHAKTHELLSKNRSRLFAECGASEMQCLNRQCVSKRAFCNRQVDCSDGSDEPVICNCAEYLKLTEPERICDGVRHCLDKSDEDPKVCHCKDSSYMCKR